MDDPSRPSGGSVSSKSQQSTSNQRCSLILLEEENPFESLSSQTLRSFSIIFIYIYIYFITFHQIFFEVETFISNSISDNCNRNFFRPTKRNLHGILLKPRFIHHAIKVENVIKKPYPSPFLFKVPF